MYKRQDLVQFHWWDFEVPGMMETAFDLVKLQKKGKIRNIGMCLSLIHISADLERLESMPGIVGYIVQPGDSLWKIAKKFHTTVEAVMEANGLSSDALMPGDRLILVKTVQ